ncbi:MAG TPA: MFS transporter [Pseudonocardiaceae bacterium]
MGLSSVGTYVTLIALPFHLSERGPVAVSAAMMAMLVPQALGAPLAGWLTDRFPNRRLMVHAQLVAAAALVLATVVLHSMPLLLAALFALGAAAAVTGPAMSALLPRMTGEELATRGYAALATARSIGTLAGLAIGGVLAEGPGVRTALAVDAATFVLLAAALATVRTERDPRLDEAGETTRESAWEGLRRLREDRVLATSMGGLAVAVLLAVLVNVAEVYFVTRVLGGGGVTFGLIMAAWAGGMVIGAKLSARLTTDRRLLLGLFGCGAGLGLMLLAPAVAPVVAVMVIAWLIGGACNMAQNVAIQGLVRSRVPDELRGRAFAGMNAVVVTANVLGTFVAGPVTAELGARAVFVTAGVGVLVASLGGLALVTPYLRPVETETAFGPGARAVRQAETASGSVVRTPDAAAPILPKAPRPPRERRARTA